jgi:hypothetical protein
MQRIEKPAIDSGCWNADHAGSLPYTRKGHIGQSQQNFFVHFTEAIIFGR